MTKAQRAELALKKRQAQVEDQKKQLEVGAVQSISWD